MIFVLKVWGAVALGAVVAFVAVWLIEIVEAYLDEWLNADDEENE